MSCKVGNQTNSQDPQAVNSRVFVGNLNTFQCSKTDVERRFQRYGRIAGISMHKGYAFIQFTNPFDARSACLGEDGRLLWGQTLDVNLVAEPKPHQTGRKRQNIAKTGNDWDYYYDSLKVQLESLYRSYYAQLGFPTPRLVPPMKRPRIHVPQSAPQRSMPNNKPTSPNNKFHSNSNNASSLSELKSYSTPDILICGNCREMFTEVEQLMEHKKTYCKLRFTCKCHMLNGFKAKSPGEEPASLLCSQCKDSFDSAWDLMVHVQAAHMLNIYQLGADTNNKDQIEDIKDEDGVICGNNGGGGNGFVGTLMSDMEDSGENQKCETNSSQMILGSSNSTFAVGVPPSYPDDGILNSSASRTTEFLQMGTYKPESRLQYPIRQMNCTTNNSSSLVFPMEASTQTSTDHHHPTTNLTTNNFDEPHCGMLSTKTEPSLLLTVANGQA